VARVLLPDLANFPHVSTGAFKPEYDAIQWESGSRAKSLFKAWREGRTGYPLVDAAMAQLNQTGYMHNRLRMVSGSFLVKDLGIDWRWGERYFAEQTQRLRSFSQQRRLAVGQFQRLRCPTLVPHLQPVSQSEKFDPDGKFIRRYLPQLSALPTKALHAPWTAKRWSWLLPEWNWGKIIRAPSSRTTRLAL